MEVGTQYLGPLLGEGHTRFILCLRARTWEGTCLGGRSLLWKGRVAWPSACLKCRERGAGVRHANLGCATQSMVRGPTAPVSPNINFNKTPRCAHRCLRSTALDQWDHSSQSTSEKTEAAAWALSTGSESSVSPPGPQGTLVLSSDQQHQPHLGAC